MPYLTQTLADPQSFRDRIQALAAQATALSEQETFTARDLARAVELNQKYVDILAEIEDSDLSMRPNE